MRISNVAPALLAGALILLSGCDKLKSRDQINQGVQAFRSAHFDQAADHFKQAITLDPTNPSAREYLATSYMSQWIPGADSPENNEMARQAKTEFLKVLDQDPNDKTALAYLASLNYNAAASLPPDQKAAQFDEAVKWYKRLIEVDPKSKDAYYTLGVIDWNKWYPALMTAKAELHMKPEDPGPIKDKKVRDDLKEKYSGIIEDGIQNLGKALEIDKEYDDAMAYLNLLYRERADLADNQEDYDRDIKTADRYLDDSMNMKKIKAARQPQGAGGIVTGSGK